MNVPSAPVSLSRDESSRLSALVGAFSGLQLGQDRQAQLGQAVQRASACHGIETVTALVEFLGCPSNRPALEEFVGSLTIGETHFFRNRPQLDALRDHVLPELIARRSDQRRLRVWSAGCSSGEEAYTLAMLVDMVLPDRDGWQISIVGTDIDRRALQSAERATYGAWSFRQVPDGVIRRYFVRSGQDHHVADRIRQMVTFRALNLVDADPVSAWSDMDGVDLILCRNVLIYFPQQTADRVVARLAGCLAPGGWLVAGHAESPMPVFRERLEPREFPMAVMFQRRGTTSGPASGPQEPQRSTSEAQIESLPAAVEVDALAVAAEYRRDGDVEAALTVLHAAAERNRADPAPLLLAATILASTRKLDAALHTVRIALDRDAFAAAGHYLQGLILRELGRARESLESLRRVVYLDPAFALGHYALGEALVSAGHTHRGERAFTAAVEAVSGLAADDEVTGGDGLTVRGLLDLVALQRQMSAAGELA